MKTKPHQLVKPRVLVPVLLLCLLSLVLDASGQNFQRKVFKLDFSSFPIDEHAAITNSILVPEGEVWEIVQLYGTSHFHFVQIQIDGEIVGSITGSGGVTQTRGKVNQPSSSFIRQDTPRQ